MPDIAPPRLELPTYTFPIKDRQRQWATDPASSFTLRSYTVAQEVDAAKAAMVAGRFDFELLQRIVIAVDGKAVDQTYNVLEKWSPNLRRLAVKCLNFIDRNEDAMEDDDATLKGVTMAVG